jgi:hypothetical protein
MMSVACRAHIPHEAVLSAFGRPQGINYTPAHVRVPPHGGFPARLMPVSRASWKTFAPGHANR